MIEMKMDHERFDQANLQGLGENWIQAIKDKAFDRLEEYCHPGIVSHLLTPRRYLTFDNPADLVAKYHGWYDPYTDFQLVDSRIDQIGGRVGINYRFLLQDQGNWFTIEQQLYCTVEDGRVKVLEMLCSGFEQVESTNQMTPMEEPEEFGQESLRDQLLEFYTEGSQNGSTCALLTPAIKSKLREMQSGQVLEVRVDDPTARGDIEAWSRLSGNALEKMIEEEQTLRFFVRKK